jgi:hypothetical protein
MRTPSRTSIDDLRSLASAARAAQLDNALRMRGPLEVWHVLGDPGEPTLQNDWYNSAPLTYGTAKFRKDNMGFVHISGTISNSPGTGSPVGQQTLWTMPVNYRPEEVVVIGLFGEDQGTDELVNGLAVYPSGVVAITILGTAPPPIVTLWLDGTSYWAG